MNLNTDDTDFFFRFVLFSCSFGDQFLSGIYG